LSITSRLCFRLLLLVFCVHKYVLALCLSVFFLQIKDEYILISVNGDATLNADSPVYNMPFDIVIVSALYLLPTTVFSDLDIL